MCTVYKLCKLYTLSQLSHPLVRCATEYCKLFFVKLTISIEYLNTVNIYIYILSFIFVCLFVIYDQARVNGGRYYENPAGNTFCYKLAAKYLQFYLVQNAYL